MVLGWYSVWLTTSGSRICVKIKQSWSLIWEENKACCFISQVNNKSCLVRYAIHVLALPMLKAKHKYSPPPSPCMQHPSTKATHLVLSFSCPLKSQQCKPLPKLFVPRTNISIKTKFHAKPFHVKHGRVSTHGDSCHVIGTV